MRNIFKPLIARTLYGAYRLLDPFFSFREISILTYHSISDAKIDIVVRPAVFEKHLSEFKKKGYAFVSLAEIVEWLKNGGPLPHRAIALTFDDGYVDFETNALPILERLKAPATMFVMSDAEASRPRLGNELPLLSSETIERLSAHPLVEFGFHGKTHANVAKLSVEALKEEMERPTYARFFAYPGGSYSHEAMHVAQELGYEAACAIKPGLVSKTSDPFLLQRNVVVRGMTSFDVLFRATKAMDWYDRAARWFK